MGPPRNELLEVYIELKVSVKIVENKLQAKTNCKHIKQKNVGKYKNLSAINSEKYLSTVPNDESMEELIINLNKIHMRLLDFIQINYGRIFKLGYMNQYKIWFEMKVEFLIQIAWVGLLCDGYLPS